MTRSMAQTKQSTDLLLQVRAELQRVADPDRAASMQAYMKSALPYHGVPAVPMRAIFKRLFDALGIPVAAGLLYPLTGQLLSPMIAAAAMALSSVSVIVNSLRLGAAPGPASGNGKAAPIPRHSDAHSH